MAQQVQLHSKIFLAALSFSLMGCGHDKIVVPATFVNVQQGNLVTREGITYIHGQPFSGWEYAVYNDHDTAFVMPFFNGRENGMSKSWYETGQLKEVRIFENGKKIGVHKGWWPDGKQKFEYHFSHDVYEGSVMDWFPSGKLFRNFTYKNGQENGMQVQYFSNGVLQFNYEAKDGRNYGLTGVKNCVNVSDSIGLPQ